MNVFRCKDNEFSLYNNEKIEKKFNHNAQKRKSPAKRSILPGPNSVFCSFAFAISSTAMPPRG